MAATYVFGTVGLTGAIEGTFGFLQNFTETTGGDIALALNAAGDVGAQQVHNEYTEISAEYIFDSTTTAPVFGDTLAIDSKNYLVESASKSEAVGEFKKISFTAKQYTAVPIPANA